VFQLYSRRGRKQPNQDGFDYASPQLASELETVAESITAYGNPQHARRAGRLLPAEVIRLGLDLQGGNQLILKVDTPHALQNRPPRQLATCGRRSEKGELPPLLLNRAGPPNAVAPCGSRHRPNGQAGSQGGIPQPRPLSRREGRDRGGAEPQRNKKLFGTVKGWKGEAAPQHTLTTLEALPRR